MDLYHIYRISLYLLAGSGAFAISIADKNIFFLVAVIVYGTIASLTVDRQRMKEVRREFALAMVFALLFYVVLQLHASNEWEKDFPPTVAHFLCAIQLLLFFVPFNSTLLLLFCTLSLVVVVISGVIEPGVSLLLRMTCFIAILSWTLFIHSLWRARERFSGKALLPSNRNGRGGGPDDAFGSGGSEAGRSLPERAFWQGLSMTAGLSGVCLALGLLLFFFAPRINESLIELIERITHKQEHAGTSPGGTGRGDAPGFNVTGFGDRMAIQSFGPIREDRTAALSVSFYPFSRELADSNGRIFLRGDVFSKRDGNEWIYDRTFQTLENAGGIPLEIHDRSLDVSDASQQPFTQPGAVEIRQVVENLSTKEFNVYFALYPVLRMTGNKVDVDSEGILHLADGQFLKRSEIWSRLPVHEHQLPENSIAEHGDRQRYIKNTGLPPDAVEKIRKLAREITAESPNAVQKVRRIVAHLRESKRYKYTLSGANHAEESIVEFLLSSDEKQRCGSCGYFASAFVVLCRVIDIPARLAGGFVSPFPDNPDELNEKVIFRNSDAHAWGEVYFKNVGWVAFDPTSAVRASDDHAPEIQPIAKPNQPPRPMVSGPDRGLVHSVWARVLTFNSSEQRAFYEKVSGAVFDGFGGAGVMFSGGGMGGWLGALIAWAAVGVMLVWLMQTFLRRSTRRKSGTGTGTGRVRAAVSFYNELLQVLSRRGFVRRPGQTPREFAEWVIKRGGIGFAPVQIVTDVFESVRYGGVELSQEEFNRLQNALDGLRELTFGTGGQK